VDESTSQTQPDAPSTTPTDRHDPARQPGKVPELLPLALVDRLDVPVVLVPLDPEHASPALLNRAAHDLAGEAPYDDQPPLFDEATLQTLQDGIPVGSAGEPTVVRRTRVRAA